MHIVAICGSLRKASCNAGLLRAIAASVPEGHTIDTIIPGDLPLFNQDIEGADVIPEAVVAFRERIAAADAFIFVVCEYNFSLSAALKNAIDWASRGPKGNLFNDKPAAVAGAAGGAGSLRAQNHFRDVSLFLNLHVLNSPSLLVKIYTQPSPFDLATGDLIDPKEQENAANMVKALIVWANRLSGNK